VPPVQFEARLRADRMLDEDRRPTRLTGVARTASGAEGHRLPVDDQWFWRDTANGLPDIEQRAPEVASSVLIVGAAPKEGRELVPRMGLPWSNGQVREKGVSLGREGKRRIEVQPSLKSSKERKGEPRHLSLICPSQRGGKASSSKTISRRLGNALATATVPNHGQGDVAAVEPEPAHANCSRSASAFSSQYVIPISRYIVVAVVRCSCACSRWPVRR